MNKTILLFALLACVVLFAVPAFAADVTPATATPQVAMASSVGQPVQLTADELSSTSGEFFFTWSTWVRAGLPTKWFFPGGRWNWSNRTYGRA